MTPLPAPGEHGGDATAVAAALGLDPKSVLDLSQSLNDAMGVDEERLLLTNGGAEAIRLVIEAIGGRVEEPEFSLHPRGDGPLWRSNPHNPSGRLAGEDDGASVWDEAFYALATGHWTRGDADAIVVGSLTKLLGCPGLRIGYVLAPSGAESLIASCQRRQSVWTVNGLAATALPDLLAPVDLPAWSARVRQLRAQLVAVLHRHGLDALPSDANWVLVQAPGLRARLAPQGVVIRDCASFGLPELVRIAVPDPAGLARLDGALSSLGRNAVDVSETVVSRRAPTPDGIEDVQKKGAR
jgi:histidinol-phosphate/aromatic aminotransferase/cobyric acid decarboxylase-like protein